MLHHGSREDNLCLGNLEVYVRSHSEDTGTGCSRRWQSWWPARRGGRNGTLKVGGLVKACTRRSGSFPAKPGRQEMVERFFKKRKEELKGHLHIFYQSCEKVTFFLF